MAIKGKEGTVQLNTATMEHLCTVINKDCSENIKNLEYVRSVVHSIKENANLSGGQGDRIMELYAEANAKIDKLVDARLKIRHNADTKLSGTIEVQKDKKDIAGMTSKTASLKGAGRG